MSNDASPQFRPGIASSPSSEAAEGTLRLVPFRGPVTLIELDAERCPINEFPARTRAICATHLEINSRRMVYDGAPILAVLPLLDSTPCVVGCVVSKCSYDTAGDYLILLQFSNYARSRFVDEWMKDRGYSIWKPSAEAESSSKERPSTNDDHGRSAA